MDINDPPISMGTTPDPDITQGDPPTAATPHLSPRSTASEGHIHVPDIPPLSEGRQNTVSGTLKIVFPKNDTPHENMIALLRSDYKSVAIMTDKDKLRTTTEQQTNWIPWKRRLHRLLDVAGCLPFVMGNYPKSMCRTPSERILWSRRDAVAKYLISGSISDELSTHADSVGDDALIDEHAADIWQRLKEAFELRSGQHVTTLYRRLYDKRADDSTQILKHLLELMELRNQIAASVSNPADRVPERMFQNIVLTALPVSWSNWTGGFFAIRGNSQNIVRQSTQELLSLIREENGNAARAEFLTPDPVPRYQ
ncbi:hypothetical protein CONPUDRAFT_155215 [Coniophora puteana RWD-64-598 SS2]|uniref:Uncharacterized protein n=1 Tax=Coniophora puteana (strain RWD-64-598) TaxID=741705 RepID=A0A5M3MKQ8_CONPW|nr:uncharacterized protein CONPUDRAFT_155215 [Coniophora puteana RWD-64-598 SS2]EIW79819.1 hypothetical protein CONPUDRAFT_155215 [Coniophora puteana RWD-64-598 SS2]